MNDNKKVLTYCPNFYKIIEFIHKLEEIRIKEKTEITPLHLLIKMYKEYIFKVDININENIIEIGKLDEAVSKYIDDYIFRKELKKGLQELKVKNDCKDILKFVIDYIINLFNRYKASNTRVIYISRWI